MTDTDGVYDLCKCGERPVFRSRVKWDNDYPEHCVTCECGEATKWHERISDVMVEWNRRQRGYKEPQSLVD